ncbi:lipoprotein [Aquabacterium sp. CECT 9606]|jgi:predicted small lipoprotein YifL|uniref:LPS translocon maturation chaperone LptM n=1 Tax=Aquabacterium sp. CECT 9606 TaxID=2845822 RepID=UPI001E301A07|nr:lipoprotein [Aquabacterium sp. CECT 9606]
MKKQSPILGSIAKPLPVLALLGTLLLSACGQKGPLYLPSPPDQGAAASAPSGNGPTKDTTP